VVAAPAAAAPAADAIVPIVVVEARLLPSGATFTAADGTRWVQTDSHRIVDLPDTPFDAEIKPGAMGSRFLLPKGHSRPIRVRVAR
jgi:hypothetical protein